VLECLGKHVPPAQFIGTFFKGIWTLKRLARAAKLRVLARKKQAVKAQRSTPRASKTSTGVVLLRQRLENLHLAMRTIAGDGNCQFRAFSQNLFGTEEQHALVRARAVEYMKAHAADFRGFIDDGQSRRNGNFSDYLSQMSKGRTWGDELTLRALCNAFGATVHVITSQEGSQFYLKYVPEVNQVVAKQVFLAYVSPSHYNAFECARPSTPKRKRAGPARAPARNAKAPRGSK
jgi:hypothetical protein